MGKGRKVIAFGGEYRSGRSEITIFGIEPFTKGVVDATCELARELLVLDRTAAPAGEGISRQRLADSLEITYNKKGRRPVVSHVAMAMLCKYGARLKSAGVVRVVRG